MGAIAMRMRSHRGLSAVQQGIALLRRLGDRACVFAPGVATAGGAHWISGASLTPTGGIQSLGPNLIANGDFSNGATGWTLWQPTAGVVQLESGGMRIRTTDATFAAIQPALTLSPGSTYQVTFTVRNWVNGSVQVSIDGTTAAFTSPSAAGTYTFPVVASGSCVVQIKRTGGSNCDLIVDDLSCQLLTTMPTSAWLMDYVESSANTAAAVDGPVGFLSDGAGTVGAELLVNGDFSAGTSNWTLQPGTQTATISGGVARVASADGSSAGMYNQVAVTNGATYLVTINVTAYTGSAGIYSSGSNTVAIPSGVGVKTMVFVADGTYFGVKRLAVCDISFKLLSVVKLTGRHATQGTGGNKPTLRRGIVNLQTYSNDYLNAAWAKGGVSLSAGQADPFGGSSGTLITATQGVNSYINNSVTLTAGVVYTRVVIAKAGTAYSLYTETGNNGSFFSTKFDLSSGVVSGGSYQTKSMTPLGGGFYLCLGVWTAGATGTPSSAALYVDNYGAALGNNNLTIAGAGLFVGAYTPQQILQCGGVPLTTASPASSAQGNFGLDGDGASKYLSVPSAPVQMLDDFALISGAMCTNGAPLNTVLSLASTTASNPVIEVGFTNGGIPRAVWRDDSGGLVQQASGSAAIGTPVVITARKSGNNKYQRTNAVQVSLDSTVLAGTTANTVGIGARPGSSWANFMNGRIYPQVIVKGAISDSELLVLERFVGSLTGPTGVRF